MKIKWFVGVKNYKDLRKKYVVLSKKYHPDKGGNTETMQEINAEHALMCKLLKIATEEPTEEKKAFDIEFTTLKFATGTKINSIKLRPYQIKFLNEILDRFAEGHTSVCGVAPCGAGKTIMTGSLIKKFAERGKRVIFFVHRQELIEQTSKTFTALGIEHGIISASVKQAVSREDRKKPVKHLVQIASVQTLVNRLSSVDEPDLLVCDECHHILAKSYLEILDTFSNALLLGVTATPQRTGGINLGDVFTAMVQAPSTKELIKMGNLTRFKYYAPPTNPDLMRVRVKFGEFVNKDLAKVMSEGKIIGNIIEHYKTLALGKSAICYCVNVEHSKTVAERFNAAGIPAAHYDGETDKSERARIVEDFRQGKIKVLCNAELFGEGFDVPNMQAVILARPTKSLILFTQQALRPLRPDPNDPNKIALIIDHTHNSDRFGLPDEDRKWSLDPNEEKEEDHAPLKTCPECYEVVPLATQVCPECGYVFFTNEMPKEEEVPLYHIWRPTTPEEFLVIAKERKYKIGWVAIHALEFAKTYEDCLKIAQICNYKEGWAWYKWKEIQQRVAG